MNNKYFLKLFLSAALIFRAHDYSHAADGQPHTGVIKPGLGDSPVVSEIFKSAIPAEYQVLQAGGLTREEGGGEFLVLTSTGGSTKVVILSLDKLSWFKTKEIASSDSAKVGKQLVSRFFPEVGPVSVSEDKQGGSAPQYASHLHLVNSQGVNEPAIALRLLYPRNKAYILLLWQQVSVQNFPLAYQQLENQAKTMIKGFREPSAADTQVSERYILWRLRHIFKKGVFTHLVAPKRNQ